MKRSTSETFEDDDKHSGAILAAIHRAQDYFREWDDVCHRLEETYGLIGNLVNMGVDYGDSQLDLFWASYEVMKVAIYAHPPQPVVSPLFKDGKPLFDTTAEMLERVTIASFKESDIDLLMKQARDDLLFYNRGVMWVRYDDGDTCIDHVDRVDFVHEPSRYWGEVGWIARAFYLSEKDFKKRFENVDIKDVNFTHDAEQSVYGGTIRTTERKAKVWEVWHRADNKVYWVCEGHSDILEKSEPYLKLKGFYPCPRPAYGTTRLRSLMPVPDWERYATHFRKISDLTQRVYTLLDTVRMKGLIPAGGDVGDAIQELIRSDRDDQMLIPVPQAAFNGGSGDFVQWMPLDQVATAITGLIEARSQLISDFYELSGISDIMRGATDAGETLGAQQLKSQYGSVRIREKSEELQRLAADAVAITAEIIAEHYSKDKLLEMSQMNVPSRKEIKARIKGIEEAAASEMEMAADKLEQEGMEDPNAAQQALAEAQQQILARHGPQLREAEQVVAIEDVMELLRDDRTRCFVFEIESSSTILTDEVEEKHSRNEFLQQFTSSSQALMGLAGMGEAGAALAGELLKFSLAPYRAGRSLDGAIDAFIDQAPQMAANMEGDGDSEGLIAAQNKLADAEMAKAQAAQSKVEADSMLKQAEGERKAVEMQMSFAIKEAEQQRKIAELQRGAEADRVKADEAMARVDLIRAQTMKALADAKVTLDDATLDEFKSLADIELRQNDQAMALDRMSLDQQNRQVDQARADRGEQRAGIDQAMNQNQGQEQ